MSGRVVAFLNMKGGVGKTTLAAGLGYTFAVENKVHPLLIDLDPQYNLTQLLLEREEYDELRTHNKTLSSVFDPSHKSSLFSRTASPMPAPPVGDLRFELLNGEAPKVGLVAGDFDVVRFGLGVESELLVPATARFQQFIANARKEHELVFLDCNPSGSFLTSCALRAASDVIVPVRPDRFSVLGVEHVKSLINLHPDAASPRLHIVLNGIRPNSPQEIERDLQTHREFGKDVVLSQIKHTENLVADPTYVGFIHKKGRPHITKAIADLRDVAAELWLRWRRKNGA